CGSCWAFTTTAAIESHYALKKGKNVSLSEQNLIDCSDRNDGCDGGNSAKAMMYIYTNGGTDTDRSYPYDEDQYDCRFSRASVGATDYGYVDVRPRKDEDALMEAVATIGPIAVAFDASSDDFEDYDGEGIYYGEHCSSHSADLDHTLLVIGYGNDLEYGENGDYWLVKN
ncbi:hypothetical protein PMAYCL1PPCAC_33153, partial [Pristionchus mayeri]